MASLARVKKSEATSSQQALERDLLLLADARGGLVVGSTEKLPGQHIAAVFQGSWKFCAAFRDGAMAAAFAREGAEHLANTLNSPVGSEVRLDGALIIGPMRASVDPWSCVELESRLDVLRQGALGKIQG